MADLTPDVDVLERDISLGIAVLRRHGADFWADWPEADARRIAAGDVHGLKHLLQAFGGMGSFNDLFIHSVNGDPISDSDALAVNAELDRLRSSIYDNAKALLRESEL